MARGGGDDGEAGGRERSPLVALIGPVYAPTLIWAIGSGAFAPVLVLAALQLGYSQSLASALAGVSGLVGVLTGPTMGRAVARFGDRTAFIVGTSLAAVALGTTLGVMALPHSALGRAAYLVAVVMLAVASNLWSLARQSYVAESVPAGFRARGMSLLGGMMRLGQLIGPGVGSVAIMLWGLPGSFALQLATALIALAVVMAFALPDAGKSAAGAAPSSIEKDGAATHPLRPLREKADIPATLMLSAAVVIINLVRVNRTVLIPLWGHQQGISDGVISMTFAAAAVMDTAMFYPAGRMMDARGRRWALLPTLILMAAGFAALALSHGQASFVASAMLIGFGNGFGAGIIMTMGADLSPDIGRSRFLGFWQSISQIGGTVGPFIVSGLVAAWGVYAGVWFTAVLGALGALWCAVMVPVAYRRLGTDERGMPLGE